MSIRTKALIITGLTAVLLVPLLWVANEIIIRGFVRLEDESVRRNVHRVINAIHREMATLSWTAADWGLWGDTARFVQGEMPKYAEENLNAVTLNPLRLNFMILVDDEGRIVATVGCDLKTGEPKDLPASMRDLIRPGSPLLEHLDSNSASGGLLRLREGPALVSWSPIRDINRDGPTVGSLVIGRFLNSDELQSLSERLELSLDVYSVTGGNVPPDVERILGTLGGVDEPAVIALSEEEIAGYVALSDIYKEPALLFRVIMPRDIYLRGLGTVRHTFGALLLGVLLVGLFHHGLLEQAVLSRMARLSENVRRVGIDGGLGVRSQMTGDDEVSKLAGSIDQVLRAKEEADRIIKHRAYHDVVTGLPNRLLFEDRLGMALAQAQRSRAMLGVMCIDLDRFKMVNDTFGHAVGDQLLRQVAHKLKHCMRTGDTACRTGGDEFAVLLPCIRDAQGAVWVAQRIVDAFRKPFSLDGHEVHISSSVGVCVSTGENSDGKALLQRADSALYEAKREGRDRYVVHSPDLDQQSMRRLELENDLWHAVERGELVLDYQPQVEIETGRIVAIEALVRWMHPKLGVLMPSEFLALGEEAGLIGMMGRWVLNEACAQVRRWQERAPLAQLPWVAVNLSAQEIHQSGLAQSVGATLAESGVSPKLLEVEITESSVMRNVSSSIVTLNELKDLGVRLALDDFGLGNSSLINLKRLPVDTLKIDQSFIRDIATDINDQAIVEAVIAMARALDLGTVAEGVETREQLEFLRMRGCWAVQGYLIQEPTSSDEISEMLNAGCRLTV